ncbi:MAG: YfbM family protein, partial [Candidatus Cybelea sp.]
KRRAGAEPSSPSGKRDVLSLDKAWHGVHYLLCGESEPGPTLLSQAVLGGSALGDDDEGFSGYGPARYFTAERVAQLAAQLSAPELEAEAVGRFDAGRMEELGIYPGWKASDADWVMDGFRRLRDFYAEAARKGNAIVTCLV